MELIASLIVVPVVAALLDFSKVLQHLQMYVCIS